MRQSQGKGTSDSICCGSSNLLMSIQLFQSSFITLLLKVFWLFPLFAGFIILMLIRHSLQRNAHFNSKIICNKVSSLSLFCDLQMLLTVHFVMKDPYHALCGEFERLSHGRRFISLVCKANRGGNSFVPTAVRLLNRAWLALCASWTNMYTVSRLYCLNVWWFFLFD